ncbi:hypothetical protein GCM10022237_28750 [Nocardioides ginsengisoli]|uniref:Secreted protein n=1 Tax=Nocardioides ginsengisoli TaxID=363868 RepID=A0ABW3W434_9ACTN
MTNTRRLRRLISASTLIAATAAVAISPSPSASADPSQPVTDSAQMYADALAALGDEGDSDAGLGGVTSESTDSEDAGAGLGAVSSESLDSTATASAVGDGEGGVDGPGDVLGRPLYVCLSTANLPTLKSGPARAIGTATVGCSGNPVGITFRLRLEAYYGGGWHLMTVDKGAVAAGTTKFSTAYLCGISTPTAFRTVGKFYRSGVVVGWTAYSSSEPLYCR